MQAAEGPEETSEGSLPGVVPLNSVQISLTLLATTFLKVAVSPKLELMPAGGEDDHVSMG
ncbi:hypothetical protein CH063_05702 [Colletotrichum higginsianum]|uniref:Uncharacterized protein n=1 Tax=Colletotrichum higginsianum (strain IMI 349063) TaxID=759273 RepID=H1UZY3_COLHI|nr:hypothetical protein CH063_05702 [Colletotrichum higginsianum]